MVRHQSGRSQLRNHIIRGRTRTLETASLQLDIDDLPSERDVGHCVRWAADELRSATDAPRLEAEVLLSHVLQMPRATLLAYPERLLTPDRQAEYAVLIQRRAAGYPLPYLTRTAEFYGLTFEVSPEVLIPRPETEMLVDLVLARRPASVVDVGTGSGCIAVSLAVHLPGTIIHATEISQAALAVAQKNVARHGVAGQVRLIVGNVLNPRPAPVDLIISNPPYVSTSACAFLPTSIRLHEPRLALDGGPDGLDVIRQLLNQAPAVLRPAGALLVEIGADQGEAVTDLAQSAFPRATVRVLPDLAGRDRVLEVQT